jgi:hypothetical protein
MTASLVPSLIPTPATVTFRSGLLQSPLPVSHGCTGRYYRMPTLTYVYQMTAYESVAEITRSIQLTSRLALAMHHGTPSKMQLWLRHRRQRLLTSLPIYCSRQISYLSTVWAKISLFSIPKTKSLTYCIHLDDASENVFVYLSLRNDCMCGVAQ